MTLPRHLSSPLGSRLTCLLEQEGLDLTAFKAMNLFRKITCSRLSWQRFALPAPLLTSTATDLRAVHPRAFQTLFRDLSQGPPGISSLLLNTLKSRMHRCLFFTVVPSFPG